MGAGHWVSDAHKYPDARGLSNRIDTDREKVPYLPGIERALRDGAKEMAEQAAVAGLGADIGREIRGARERLDRLTRCRLHRETYIEYARQRIADEDWHGLSDAANDLRELDVEIRMLEER